MLEQIQFLNLRIQALEAENLKLKSKLAEASAILNEIVNDIEVINPEILC